MSKNHIVQLLFRGQVIKVIKYRKYVPAIIERVQGMEDILKARVENRLGHTHTLRWLQLSGQH